MNLDGQWCPDSASISTPADGFFTNGGAHLGQVLHPCRAARNVANDKPEQSNNLKQKLTSVWSKVLTRSVSIKGTLRTLLLVAVN